MDTNLFRLVVERRFRHCADIMFGTKDAEYSRGGDKHHNFKVQARLDGTTPERSLWGNWKKHLVSILDMIDGVDAGKPVPPPEIIQEKFSDMVNYTVLLEGLLLERSRLFETNPEKTRRFYPEVFDFLMTWGKTDE